MPLGQRVKPFPIETCDQVSDSIPTLPPGGMGRCLKAGSAGNREQFRGSCDPGGRSNMRSAHLLTRQTFFGREGTKWIFLMSGHGKLRGGETKTICSWPTPGLADRQSSRQPIHQQRTRCRRLTGEPLDWNAISACFEDEEDETQERCAVADVERQELAGRLGREGRFTDDRDAQRRRGPAFRPAPRSPPGPGWRRCSGGKGYEQHN